MYSITIIEQLIEDQWGQNYDELLPDIKFFEPTEYFISTMQKIQTKYAIKMFIDCGAGSGHVSKELTKKGIKTAACDIHKRESHVGTEVQIIPAHRMPFNRDIWPLVCRPDHSGWCPALWQRALVKDSGFIYCGKEEAIEFDICKEISPDYVYKNVGQENEVMAIWEPIPDLVEFLEQNGVQI